MASIVVLIKFLFLFWGDFVDSIFNLNDGLDHKLREGQITWTFLQDFLVAGDIIKKVIKMRLKRTEVIDLESIVYLRDMSQDIVYPFVTKWLDFITVIALWTISILAIIISILIIAIVVIVIIIIIVAYVCESVAETTLGLFFLFFGLFLRNILIIWNIVSLSEKVFAHI